MDKRRSTRRLANGISLSLKSLDPQVWFRFWNSGDYTLKDISLVGLGVSFKDRMPEGTCLSLELKMGNSPYSVRIFGRVEWIKQEENKQYRAGVSFSWWKDDKDRNMVCRYIENLPLLAAS